MMSAPGFPHQWIFTPAPAFTIHDVILTIHKAKVLTALNREHGISYTVACQPHFPSVTYFTIFTCSSPWRHIACLRNSTQNFRTITAERNLEMRYCNDYDRNSYHQALITSLTSQVFSTRHSDVTR
jgi:hypothetical protein